jgi:imidazolonepropionase-like amidohydrolase
MPKGAQVADGVAGLRKAVREQIAAGADWIKVYADYRRHAGGPTTPTYSQEELNAIVDEARSAGLPVAAHATIDEAIRRCVRAGVNTIEHGSSASEEVLALMREHHVALCPTLAAAEAIARYQRWKPGQPDHPRIVRAKAMFRRALQSGVTIACGSDVGVFAHGDNLRELELMVGYGMTPLQAIKSATITATAILGQPDDLGRIADGYLADLIAVEGNPLNDISVLRRPVVVIKGGEIINDRRSNP